MLSLLTCLPLSNTSLILALRAPPLLQVARLWYNQFAPGSQLCLGMWRGTRTLHWTRYITTNPSVAAVNGDSVTVLSGFNEDFHLHHFYVHSNPLDCPLYATLRHCYISMLLHCFFCQLYCTLSYNHLNIWISPAAATACCLLSGVDIGQWWCLSSACYITDTEQGTRLQSQANFTPNYESQ